MRLARVAVALALVAALAMTGVVAAVFGMNGGTASMLSLAQADTGGCTLDLGGASAPKLDAEATADARAIVNVGEQIRVPEWGWVVAVATSLQETGGSLHNDPGGDRDSAGIFQQRPSQGWGTYADVTDVEYASLAFYGGPTRPADDSDPGLLDIPGWEQMTLTQAAQAVQRSGFPDAYAKWQTTASEIVAALIGSSTTTCSTLPQVNIPPGAIGVFLSYVASVIGDWYLWGAAGPDRFDCSGLIYWAWAQAGHPMNDRTAAQMWADSIPVTAGSEQPGDLLFSEFNTRVSGPGHVAVIVSPGVAIEAQQTGTQVHEFAYTIHGDQRVGRLSGAAFQGGFASDPSASAPAAAASAS